MNKDIAKKLISNCTLQDGVLRTSLTGEDLREAYDFFRISILDGLVPVNKAIGFKLYSSKNTEDLAAVDRHTSCLENMIELSKNVAKLIFVSPTGFLVTSRERTGDVTAGNAHFFSDGKDVKVLDSSIYLFNSIEALGIRVFANESTGYHSMEDNVTAMKTIYRSDKEESSTFFPLNTNHTLNGYVRVLPFLGKDIKYKLSDKFSEQDFNALWKSYLERCVR